ncbi:MAG: hypothetical protein KGQ88_06980, partial [Chloroflexi bacterium]|nr:hypothetical protein [Chloroflexota bacterium]
MSSPRFAIVVVAIVTGLASAALWEPLARPLLYLRGALPAGAFVGSLALSLILFALRRPLQATALRLARARRVGFLVPPLLASLLFTLSWAGSHAGQAEDVGLLPQLFFPMVIGVFAFVVARYGAAVQQRGSPWFRARDRVRARERLIVLIAATALASSEIPQLLDHPSRALQEQIVVLVGLVAGYLLLAPRVGASVPTPAVRGAASTAVLALILAAGVSVLGGEQAAAATPACPASVGSLTLYQRGLAADQGFGVVHVWPSAGGFSLMCVYAAPGSDPVGTAFDHLPSLYALWREDAGTDQYSALECRGGTFLDSTGPFPVTFVSSATHRAVVYYGFVSPADTPRFGAAASALLAAIEPLGMACAGASGVVPAAPSLHATGGSIDITFAGALNGHLTELAAPAQCLDNDPFQAGFTSIDLRARLGSAVYELQILGPKGTWSPKPPSVNGQQVSVGGPVVNVIGPGAAQQGPAIPGTQWSGLSGGGTVSIANDLSGSLDLALGPPPSLHVSGTWKCTGLAVAAAPVAPPAAGGDAVEGGGDVDLVASLVSIGVDPGLAQTISAAIADEGIPVTGAVVALVTTLIGAGMATASATAPSIVATAGILAPVPAPTLTLGIVDPYTGKELPPWQPGRYGPGADGKPGGPGTVWFQGQWVEPGYARDQIEQSLTADRTRAAELDDGEFARGTAALRDQWLAGVAAEAATPSAPPPPLDEPELVARRAALQQQLKDDVAAVRAQRGETLHDERVAAGYKGVLTLADHGVAFLKGWVPGGNYYGYAYDVLKGGARALANGDWEGELGNAAVDVGKDFAGNAAQDGFNKALHLGWGFRTDLPEEEAATTGILQRVRNVWDELPVRPEDGSGADWATYGRKLLDTDATRHTIQWGENELANYATGDKHLGDVAMKGLVGRFEEFGMPAARWLQKGIEDLPAPAQYVGPPMSPY